MAKKPKVITGFIITFLIGLTFIGISLKNIKSQASTAQLSPGENNFKISFNILPSDQQQFENALEKLTIPTSIQKGVEFELDSTSSAKLALISPITTKIKFSRNQLEIEGLLRRPYTTNHLNSQQIKLPKSTNLAIAALSLSQLAKSKLNFPQSLKDWIEANKTENTNQYFINLAPDNNVFVFQSATPIDELKSLESDKLKIKEEITDDMKIIYLTHQDTKAQDQTISVAKAQNTVFIVPSAQTVKDFINFQKSPEDEIDFPNKSKEKTSYVIYAKNNSEHFQDILRDLVLNGQPQALTFTKNVESFYLALSNQSFSALIVVK